MSCTESDEEPQTLVCRKSQCLGSTSGTHLS
uniref:Uncharacterized protein n=1 Tax=Arundo donax TaxID=35708 RepID=A0A0A9H179_ARUDO